MLFLLLAFFRLILRLDSNATSFLLCCHLRRLQITFDISLANPLELKLTSANYFAPKAKDGFFTWVKTESGIMLGFTWPCNRHYLHVRYGMINTYLIKAFFEVSPNLCNARKSSSEVQMKSAIIYPYHEECSQ